MKYLLDTNICIHYFKGHNGVMKKIEKLSFENVAISEITLAELYIMALRKVGKEKPTLA